MNGIRSQDIVVLLKLVSLDEQKKAGASPDVPRTSAGEDPYSVRNLEELRGISKTEVNASINRSLSVRLAIRDRKNGRPKTNRCNLHSFVMHGLKYVFPAKIGALTRGIPTTLPPRHFETCSSVEANTSTSGRLRKAATSDNPSNRCSGAFPWPPRRTKGSTTI